MDSASTTEIQQRQGKVLLKKGQEGALILQFCSTIWNTLLDFLNLLFGKPGVWLALISPFSGLGHPTCSDIILDIYLSTSTQNVLNISSLQTGVTVTAIHVFFFIEA